MSKVIKGGTVLTADRSYTADVKIDSGIISEIGVKELTQAGVYIDSRTFRSFEVFFTLTILYIFLSLTLKTVLKIMYNRIFFWAKFR